MKVRTYFQAFIQSISSPAYYVDVLNASLSFSVKFFLMSYVLLAILATLFFIQFDIPKYQALFRQNSQELLNNFPSDLVLKWNGSELATTGLEQIEINYPSGIPTNGLPEKLAYINVNKNSPEAILENTNASSLFLVNKDTLFVSNRQGEWSPLPLHESLGFDEPFSIDKQSLPSTITAAEQIFTDTLRALAVAYPFFYFFIIGFFRFLTLTVNALFVFYLLKLLGKNFRYKKVLQICLHVAVVSALLEILTSQIISTDTLNIYSLSFWLYLIVIMISLWNVKNVVFFKKSDKQ